MHLGCILIIGVIGITVMSTSSVHSASGHMVDTSGLTCCIYIGIIPSLMHSMNIYAQDC